MREARDLRDRARAHVAKGECPRTVRQSKAYNDAENLAVFAEVAERRHRSAEKRSGSVCYSFYRPDKGLSSNDCRKLKSNAQSKYLGLF